MSDSEHGHEHGSHEHTEKPHKATALWLIVTTLIICIGVPLLLLVLMLPESP